MPLAEWRWTHEGPLSRRFHLTEGERVLATMTLPPLRKRRLFQADVWSNGRAFTIKNAKRWRWHFSLHDEFGAELAHLRVGLRPRGEVALRGGRVLGWKPDSLFHREWVVEEAGEPVARYDLELAFRLSGAFQVDTERLGEGDAVAVASLTWHHLLLSTQALRGGLS